MLCADIQDCMAFLKETNVGDELPDVKGKHVVVLGGGNVALDVARTAIRMESKSVSVLCVEPRDNMPAHEWEVNEAGRRRNSHLGRWFNKTDL